MADQCTRAKLLRDQGNRLVEKAQATEHQIYTASTKMGKGSGRQVSSQHEVVQDLYKRAKGKYREALQAWKDGRCGGSMAGARKRRRRGARR
jgi:hypothetical protein